jgi:lysozyme family protein
MTNIAAITAENARLWQTAKIIPKRLSEVNAVAVSQAVWGTPDRWPVVAVIHEREASGCWDCQLGKGDPLAQISTPCLVGRSSFIPGTYRATTHGTAL